MEKYVVYQRETGRTWAIAAIEGETITGERAEEIEKVLRENGFPEITPDLILHGSIVFAVRVPDDYSCG